MRFTIERWLTRLCLLAALNISLVHSAGAEPAAGAAADSVDAAMDRLSIKLPANVARGEPMRKFLDQLGREPCDQKAIYDLGNALDKAGYRREAATAHITFSGACGGYEPSLRIAVNILLRLSDYTGAATAASDLIKLDPIDYNAYYLRGLAYERGGLTKKAMADFVTVIELFPNKERISSSIYVSLARGYEKFGQFCDAVHTIETWVALNPASNDTSQARALIADYAAKGRCEVAKVSGDEVIATPRSGTVVRVPVTINGVRGNFVLDTGASFVSMKDAFARKAKVAVDPDSPVRLHTANGVADGKLGRAATVQLRSLSAKDVPVVVQNDEGNYGDGIDGLLGMSFLSSFKVTFEAHAVRISGRGPK